MARKPIQKESESSDAPEPGLLDRVTRWRARVQRARTLRERWEKDFRVQDCEQYFLGVQSGGPRRHAADLVFNHFRATARTMKPSLLYSQPKFFVRPKRGLVAGAQDLNAAIGEGVLDTVAGQNQNLKRAASLALWQSFFRCGVLKMCYDPRLIPNPQAGLPIYVEGPDGMVVRDADDQPMQKIDPLTNLGLVEPDEVLTDEVYHFAYVDAANLLLPDEGPDRARWSWIGEEITVPLEEAKADSRFPKDKRALLRPNAQRASARKNRPSKETLREEDQELTYVEIWDRRKAHHLIYVDGQVFDDFLLDEPVPSGVVDDPYALLMLGDPILGPTPMPWPVPFTYSWLDVQSEYNINRKQVQNAAKRAARKIYYDESTFADEDEIAKATNSDDMAFVKLNDTTKPPVMTAEPTLSTDVYQAVAANMQDWRIITGQTGARLAGGSDAATATEASFVERAANLRDADSQDLVNDWLTESGRKMWQLVKSTLTLELWIKLRSMSDEEFVRYIEMRFQVPREMLALLDQQMPGFRGMIRERIGPEQWRTVTREELMFEADVEVVPGSAKPRTLEAEKRSFIEFWTLVSSAPQLSMSKAWLTEAARMYDGLLTKQVIDEVHALAMQMIQVNAQQAGRDPAQAGKQQGGKKGQVSPEANGAQASTAGAPDTGASLAGLMGGL